MNVSEIQKEFLDSFIQLVDTSSEIISIINIENEELLIEDLKTSAYELAIEHQKEIEININKMLWLTGDHFGFDVESLVVYCATNNIRWMNTLSYHKNKGIYNGWFYRCNLAIEDNNYQPGIINTPLIKKDKKDKTLYGILSKHSNVISTNKNLIWVYKILNKFWKKIPYTLEKYRDVYLSEYKKGIQDFLKENDKKFESDMYLNIPDEFSDPLHFYLQKNVDLYYKCVNI